jgi:hypothetical protein
MSRRVVNPTGKTAQASAALYSVVAGKQIPDHELTTFGPANVTRRFDLDDPTNGPSAVFRLIRPFDGYVRGYSASDIAAQDIGALLNNATADPKTALNPITPMALFIERTSIRFY